MKRFLPLLCLLLVLPSCTPAEQPQQQNGPAELRAFSSAADLKDYLLGQYFGPDTRTSLEIFLDDVQGKTRAPATMPSHYPGTAAPYDPVTVSVGGFAGTDPQALRANGIDTARLVGDHLFALSTSGLTILQAVPADQMTIVSHFETPAIPTGLRPLDGNRLVLLTNSVDPDYSFTPSDDAWLPDSDPFYDVYILDASTPAAPVVLARYSIQGNPIAARVIDGTRLVLFSASYPGGDPYNPPRNITYAAAADILPTCRLTDANGHQSVSPLLSWSTVLRPANPDGGAILSLINIDLANPGALPTAVGMVGYWEMAYSTPTSLYLTNTAWQTDGTNRYNTELHRFDLTGPSARYAGSAKLPGRPLPRNAFSEKDSLLRLVTTSLNLLPNGSVTTTPHLFVLDPSLQVAGEFDDFGTDTLLSGVEYIGDYVVFSASDGQADHSVFVDLADPQHPAPLGSATLCPYVGYLHLLDATHALAMGSLPINPDDPGTYLNDFSLMMYDLPSVAGIALTHSVTIGTGGTSSIALTYRRDLFLSDGLLALPVDLYESTIPGDGGRQTFGGLYLYRIAPESGFTPLGRIETADPYAYVATTRTILKDDILYAVTNVTVQAVSLNAPEQVLSKVRLQQR